MMKTFPRAMAGALVILTLPAVVRASGVASLVQGPPPVTAAQAAPFLGEWTLAMQGPNGPATMTLSITAEKEKVSAEISSDVTPKQPISTISLVEKTLVLGYSFLYEGNPVDAVVSLTPDKDGKPAAASIDFAGGAYVMSGTATKKEKEKEKDKDK
jgi:hypothetical protein